MAAIECARTEACRAFGFPPKEVSSAFKVRGCAIVLARTAAELLQKSPAARTRREVYDMGSNIIRWARRAEEALCANTPIALGKRTRLHNGLVDFVWQNVWKRGDPLPNIHALDLAQRYAFDAKAYVEDRIESGQDDTFWFEADHSEYLLFDAVSVPLAIYITKMKERHMVEKELDQAILSWNARKQLIDGKLPEPKFLGLMLKHCWRDELRNWNYLIGALGTAIKWIEKNGTEASLDLSNHDTDEKYAILLEYIWDDPVKTEPKKKLKFWLINNRFWVVAEKRSEAKRILTLETGHIAKDIKGVPMNKKLYDEKGEVEETVEQILSKMNEPCFYGVEK
jgi:hypothetical protein